MLYRRKVILALVQALGDRASKTDFQKHLFLYTRSQEEPAYDFFPYKYGCYSLVAESDRQTLVKQGRLKEGDVWARPRNDDYAKIIRTSDRDALIQHLNEFGNLWGDALIQYVYRKYPYYAIHSTIAEKLLSSTDLISIAAARPQTNDPALLTIGYEGKSIESYLNELIVHNVDILCDVRRNPLSRKYGFSKRSLQRFVETVGVGYEHLPNLGIESSRRKSLNTQEDYDHLFDEYERESLPNCAVDLNRIISWLEEGKRVALTCFELHHTQCHRGRVAKAITENPKWLHTLLHI